MEKENEVKIELKITNMEDYNKALHKVKEAEYELSKAVEELHRIELKSVFEQKVRSKKMRYVSGEIFSTIKGVEQRRIANRVINLLLQEGITVGELDDILEYTRQKTIPKHDFMGQKIKKEEGN